MKFRGRHPGQIYAVLFSNGWMKAGRSYRGAAGRIKSHCRTAAIANAVPVAEMVVEAVSHLHLCEMELLNVCRNRFAEHAAIGKEWFKEVPASEFEALRLVMSEISCRSSGLAHTCPTFQQAMAGEKFDAVLASMASQSASTSEPPDPRYLEALGIAKLLQTMVSNDSISGAVFTEQESLGGISRFTLVLSIHLYGMDDESQADCVRTLVDGLGESDLRGLFEVMADSENTVAAMLAEHDRMEAEAAL